MDKMLLRDFSVLTTSEILIFSTQSNELIFFETKTAKRWTKQVTKNDHFQQSWLEFLDFFYFTFRHEIAQ